MKANRPNRNKISPNFPQSQKRQVLFDFTASWCKPCQKLKPVYDELAKAHPELLCCVVDVDELDDVALECEATSLPAIHLYRGGKCVEKLGGLSIGEDGLRALVAKAVETGKKEE